MLNKLLEGKSSYDEALLATGLPAVKPPLVPGMNGETFYTLQPFQILSWYPRAVLFPQFTDQRTRQRFLDLATPRLNKSDIVRWHGATEQNIRTSFGAYIASHEDDTGLLADVERRVARQCMLPVSHGEAYNVLRYNLGQKYDSHVDVFRRRPAPHRHMRSTPRTKLLRPRRLTKLAAQNEKRQREYERAMRSQRATTTLLYLTTPEEGGHTIFKQEGRDAAQVTDFISCDKGFKYKPRAGDALMFWSLHPNRTLDPHALHGGCPVTKGQKWAATKWVHDLPRPEAEEVAGQEEGNAKER